MFIVIAHNIRSAHNIGSIFRTSDGAGVDKIFLTGYSPTPADSDALYRTSAQKQLAKTALGAEHTISWEYKKSPSSVIQQLKKDGLHILALEQNERSISLFDQKRRGIVRNQENIALLLGNEVRGVHSSILKRCDTILEIPMYGKKNSLNVSVAFGVAAYTLRGMMK